MPLFFKFALEPSILIGNISYALALVLSLYKKKSSKNNILYFSLHFLIIFVLEFVLTGTFIYIKWPNFSYSFYLKYFLVSLLYLVPINFFDNKSSMRSKIAIALSIYAMHFTLGELGGGIPVLFQNVNYGKTLDTIIRNFCTISLIFFGLFINRFNLKKIKKIPSIAIIFICTYSVLEIILSYYSTTRFQARSFNTSLFQVLVFLVISIINYLSYYMIYTICNKNDQFIQLQAKAFELEKNKELIAISDENLQKLREIKHDTKNQYACMKMLLENKQYDELNKFFDSYGDGYIHDFSREDFKTSFPTAPKNDDYVLTNEYALEQVAQYDVWDEKNNPITEMPVTDDHTTSYVLADMRGVDYDDPKWDDYINQFTIDSMAYMFSNGGWNEVEDEANGVPKSFDADSPYGYYAHALTIKNINKWYCGDPMVAATFNLEVASLLGEVFGEEAFCNKLAGGSLITGIYGYGLNVHRSAFGGRNYEYYSEDGLLSGKMAAAEASKASEKGLITFMKHYVLNDQETNRQKNGYCSWVNEQAFREIYTKGWEIYIKEAKMTINYYKVNEEGKYELASKEMPAATGIMTSYNRVGGRWAGASDSINDILRDEFGYTGTTITDAGGQPNTYMTTDLMLRKGGALTLTNNGTNGLYDTNSATAVYWLKDATKHILYNKANSNCIVGLAPGSAIKYTTAPWRIWRGVAWGVTGVLVALDAVYVTLIALDKIKVKEKQKVARDDDSDEF